MGKSSNEMYFKLISDRGDRYGRKGGLLDLLEWCGKQGICNVEEEEAKYFYEHPDAAYQEYLDQKNK